MLHFCDNSVNPAFFRVFSPILWQKTPFTKTSLSPKRDLSLGPRNASLKEYPRLWVEWLGSEPNSDEFCN
jgi:hypothetical protein